MEHADYHIVYVDNRVSRDLDGKLIQNSGSHQSNFHSEGSWEDKNPDCVKSILGEIEEVRSNLRNLLLVFDGVHISISGDTCMEKVNRLDSIDGNIQPIIVLLGIPATGEVDAQADEPPNHSSMGSSDAYGQSLVHHISTAISNSNLSKLVVPVAMIYSTTSEPIASREHHKNRVFRPSSGGFLVPGSRPSSPKRAHSKTPFADPQRALKCIDLGAVDVLVSPLQVDRLQGLNVPAYRAYKEASRERAKFLEQRRLRKRSWLGNRNDKPYAYLREAMVSELMKGICNPDDFQQTIDMATLPTLLPKREAELMHAIGSWGFSGHDLSEFELVHAACLMLQHALKIPELDKWRLSPVDLKRFLMASRAAYNGFVSYHNFRHVVDVMQAIFYFLLQLGTLPPYPTYPTSSASLKKSAPIAALLKPFDALTLLITAIGHDVGHPGVNNAFLVALNAPLAQLYNDKSVLEAFHCAAYSQILRRYWKTAFEDISMRGLMINSILATDMGMHFTYMKELHNLQEKLHYNGGTHGWSPQILEEYRVLTCALLVKCADISNVARPFEIAAKWANILQLEFANQGVMERDVGIPTTLFGGPPELDNIIKLGNSQNNFMNIFARPLFEAVTDVLPAMTFAVGEMKANQEIWTKKVKLETAKEEVRGMKKRMPSDNLVSPRSGSPDRSTGQPELSHPEGLPASQPLENSPLAQLMQASEATRRASISSIPAHLATYEPNPQHYDTSRRSSLGHQLNRVDSGPDSTTYSRRSSGASPAASTPYTSTTMRKPSNSSPSQLQLSSSLDSRSQTASPGPLSENKVPNGRASEDTLSQTHFSGGAISSDSSRRGSGGAGIGGNTSRRASKGNDEDSAAVGAAGRPIRSAHHRSSSGAHTNNTSGSQTIPYSPTDTQATSVLSVDSDDKSSQGRINSCNSTDRKGMPIIVNMDRPGKAHQFESMISLDGARDIDVRTSVMVNGCLRDNNGDHRVIGRKSSRFNFNFWKKKKGHEASP